jgi:trehalose/maltose hydrolase-like predicted phosphorylase
MSQYKCKNLVFIVIIVMMTGVIISCTKSSETEKRHGGIYIESVYFDFGTVSRDQQRVPFYFKIRNESQKEITINNAEASCSCVVIDSVPKKLKSNAVGFLYGHVNTIKQSGKLRKTIFLDFEDKQLILLRVFGEIK